MSDKITVELTEYDNDHIPVDTSYIKLSREAIADIIDHAAQLVLCRDTPDFTQVLEELTEALETYEVI